MAGTYYGKCNSLLWNMCFGWHCVIWVFLFFFWYRIARAFLQLYDGSVFNFEKEESRLSRRHCFVDYVKRGQIGLLTRLLQACGV